MRYHRLLTHRGYETPKWMEYFLTLCGTLALQGGPLFWVAAHRKHRRHADQKGDPHSPRDGRWWSHAGWLMHGEAMSEEEIARYVPVADRGVVDVGCTGGRRPPRGQPDHVGRVPADHGGAAWHVAGELV
jgi:hypothetical protein